MIQKRYLREKNVEIRYHRGSYGSRDSAKSGPFLLICAFNSLFDILKERKMHQRLPGVGGNVKSCMLAYDFNITAYTR